MADLTEVADALVQIVAAAVYPNGTTQPSVSGSDVIVYQGWPDPDTLDHDLAASKSHVSIWPRPGDTVTSVTMGDTGWHELTNNGTTGTGGREVRRQTKQFQITVWAPTPQLRSAIAKAVDLALSLSPRFALPDGTLATLAYVNQAEKDEQQKALIYRRDLIYAANYATLQTVSEFAIKQTITNVTATSAPTITVTNPR